MTAVLLALGRVTPFNDAQVLGQGFVNTQNTQGNSLPTNFPMA
jgi:hypothetical protein